MFATKWTPLLEAIPGNPYRAGHDLGEDRRIPAGTLVADAVAAVEAADEHQLEAILLRSQDHSGRIALDRVRVEDLRCAIADPGPDAEGHAYARDLGAGAPLGGRRAEPRCP
jgi:hypothetical protein